MSKISKIARIHFIGIGGASMSSLAKLMLSKGKQVSGSDKAYSEQVEMLTEWGATITIGSDISAMKDAELVVYNSAIASEDVELVYARTNGIATVERHLFLSEVSVDYEKIIAIAGTHGKTTTTAMLATIFNECGTQFTAHIGGNMAGHGNMIYKGEKYFITEACEYKKNLLSLQADIAVVLNAEYDHPDTYKNKKEVEDTYLEFCKNTRIGGTVIVGKECGLYEVPKQAISYGLEGAGYTLRHITHQVSGCYSCELYNGGEKEADLALSISGIHNLYNATACYIVAKICGLQKQNIIDSINNFKGVARRFECKGKVKEARVIIDYAHHPTEIAAAISTAKVQCEGKLHVVFQPHTFSRTACLFKEFCECFYAADSLILFKEYAARENISCGLDCFTLYSTIASTRKNIFYYDNMLKLASKVVSIIKKDDIVLILGAGDIDMLSDLIVT